MPDECDVDCNGNGVPDPCDFLPALHFERFAELDPGDARGLVLAGDLDGDGHDDVVAIGAELRVWLVPSLGEVFATRADCTGPAILRLLDGDANRDLAWKRGDELVVARGLGGGAFGAIEVVAAGAEDILSLDSGDLDGDGAVDLVVGTRARTAWWIRATVGDFAVRALPLEVPCDAHVRVADLDLDGDLDVLAGLGGPWHLCALDLWVLLNDGEGVFTIGARTGGGRDYQVADVTEDGVPDIVLAAGLVLQGIGDATFERHPSSLGLTGSTLLPPQDIDGDGDIDLLDGHTAVHIRLDDGTLERSRGLLSSPPIESSAVAHFDADRLPDIALLGADGGPIVIWRNATTPPASGDVNDNDIPDDCEAPADFHRGDANRDGRLTVVDAIWILRHLFLRRVSLRCAEAADVDDDGTIDISDPVSILDYLFLGGAAPQPPGPPRRAVRG